MRPRPTPAAGKRLTAITLFLVTGCIWWRAAALVKEEWVYARIRLGIDVPTAPSRSSNFDGSGFDDQTAARHWYLRQAAAGSGPSVYQFDPTAGATHP